MEQDRFEEGLLDKTELWIVKVSKIMFTGMSSISISSKFASYVAKSAKNLAIAD